MSIELRNGVELNAHPPIIEKRIQCPFSSTISLIQSIQDFLIIGFESICADNSRSRHIPVVGHEEPEQINKRCMPLTQCLIWQSKSAVTIGSECSSLGLCIDHAQSSHSAGLLGNDFQIELQSALFRYEPHVHERLNIVVRRAGSEPGSEYSNNLIGLKICQPIKL
jgi:hypothetical protein